MNKSIKLTESILKRMIQEAINEYGETEKGQNALGQLAARKIKRNDWNGYSDVDNFAAKKRDGATRYTPKDNIEHHGVKMSPGVVQSYNNMQQKMMNSKRNKMENSFHDGLNKRYMSQNEAYVRRIVRQAIRESFNNRRRKY